jgi:hypothetical protein
MSLVSNFLLLRQAGAACLSPGHAARDTPSAARVAAGGPATLSLARSVSPAAFTLKVPTQGNSGSQHGQAPCRNGYCARFHPRHDYLPIAVVFEKPAPFRLQCCFDPFSPHKGVPVDVVVKVAGEIGPGDEGRPQQQALKGLERPVIDCLLTPAGKGVGLDEIPGGCPDRVGVRGG